MKKYSLAFAILGVLFIALFSCKKINEGTTLGGDLIPGVDNINTFERALNTITNNRVYNDTSRVQYSDYLAVGHVVDPQFGTTHANIAFTIMPSVSGTNPFVSKDSVIAIDSVVLSLAYKGAWGDTLANGVQTLRVFEIAQNSGFRDDTTYKYNDPASDFSNATTGVELGSKTYTIRRIGIDSQAINHPTDTSKVVNVVRIRLNNSIGQRFAQFDTTSSVVSGGFYKDTGRIFRKLFKGLVVKSDQTGNALAYFNLADINSTKLTVYFRSRNGKDTIKGATNFIHLSAGRTNYIQQTPGGLWATYRNNTTPSDDLITLQSSPSGSYASVAITGIDTLKNKVVHLAEIIATIPDAYRGSVFTPPSQLFLDHYRNDTAHFLFERDITLNSDFSISLQSFDGRLRNNSYHFNITRYIQNLLTTGASNDTLRISAPFRTQLRLETNNVLLPEVQINPAISGGRVVLGGGVFADPNQKLRLRIIYSNL